MGNKNENNEKTPGFTRFVIALKIGASLQKAALAVSQSKKKLVHSRSIKHLKTEDESKQNGIAA